MNDASIMFLLLFQLNREGASSSPSLPFHPFKEFNKRIGIYLSPITPIRPTLPETYRTASFEELEACRNQEIIERGIMGDSSSD